MHSFAISTSRQNVTSWTRSPPRPTDAPEHSNDDSKLDEHNILLGPVVLLLALASLVVALLRWRQGRRLHWLETLLD